MRPLNQAHIQIVGPDRDGGFVVEFCKHTGPRLVFVVPPNADNDVLAYFQERMPYGIAVPDVSDKTRGAAATRLRPGTESPATRRHGRRPRAS